MKALRRILTSEIVLSVVRWVLGLIFIASALGKIAGPAAFADSVANYRLLPVCAVNIFAIILPWIEFLVGLSLINGVAVKSGALLAAIMSIIFIGAAASAKARGLNIDCGCFSIAKSKVGWELIGRDLVFLAMAVFVLVHRKRIPRNLIDYVDTPALLQDPVDAHLSAD